MFELRAYPKAIAQNAERLAHFDKEVAEVRVAIAALENEVLMSLAFDKELKNEEQRKARRFEVLSQHQGYQEVTDYLLEITLKRAECAALLECLRNEFTILKLEMRIVIASHLGSTDAADLLGV